MTKVLVSRRYPELKIVNPETGEPSRFSRGRLVLEDDDPNYDVVMRVATTEPYIAILADGLACPVCYEAFPGKMGEARLAKHLKNEHPDNHEPVTVGVAVVKPAAEFSCEVCNPAVVFETDEALAEHTALVHTAKKDEPAG